jgi:hypothetical protein
MTQNGKKRASCGDEAKVQKNKDEALAKMMKIQELKQAREYQIAA